VWPCGQWWVHAFWNLEIAYLRYTALGVWCRIRSARAHCASLLSSVFASHFWWTITIRDPSALIPLNTQTSVTLRASPIRCAHFCLKLIAWICERSEQEINWLSKEFWGRG
jgi:hypothetical protein